MNLLIVKQKVERDDKMAINNWTANGRLTKDAELRYSGSGQGILTFTLAVQRDYKDENGDRPADFINCVLFGSSDAEKCRATKLVEYLTKGTQINVTARIQSRNYENNEGMTVYVTEAVIQELQLLGSPQEQQNNRRPGRNTNRQSSRR